MSKNVLIPQSTLERIIWLLEGADISNNPNVYDYLDVIHELKVKMQKIEIRNTYAKIIRADTPDSKHDARIDYLRQKSQLGKIDV